MGSVSGAADGTTRSRIVESARECFLRQGVTKTRMVDVAVGAGVVRQTVYDSVSGRDELVDLAMRARSREMADLVRRPVDPEVAVGDQLVSLLAAMIETARSDPEFNLLADALPAEHALRFMAGPSPLTEVADGLLAPLVVRARQEGSLRDDVDADEMVAWVQTILAPLMARGDLVPTTLRRTLRLFVLPALLRPGAC